MAKKDEPSMAEVYKEALKLQCRKCWMCFVRGAPPEVCEDVQELFDNLGVEYKHSQQIYSVFHELRQSESEDIVKVATEVDLETVLNLIEKRRRWCEPILKRLLELGGNEEDMVTWDNFLYIFLRFCSLSRVELCQCLFMIIGLEVETDTPHYLKIDDLEQFYKVYMKSPVKSFNTRGVDFHKFPHKRYYVNDFAELTQRYTQLLNPIIHLQRSLQEKLPSVEFWDSYDRHEVFARKINFEFFTMEKTRMHLRGEPPFRESCLMLAPESLGGKPCNREQWDSRTYGVHERTGALNEGAGKGPDGNLPPPGMQYRSLIQKSVWGEHPLPEDIKILQRIAEEEKKRKQQKTKETHLLWSQSEFGAAPTPSAEQLPPPALTAGAQAPSEKDKSLNQKPGDQKAGQPLALPAPPAPGQPLGKPATQAGPMQAGGTQAGGKTVSNDMDGLPNNPAALSLQAACLNEDLAEPVEDLPPLWMRNFAMAPAPRPRLGRPDPPLASIQREHELRAMEMRMADTSNSMSNSRVTWWDDKPPANGDRPPPLAAPALPPG